MRAAAAPAIPFADAVRVWIRVALLSFGGPAGQIAVMHRIVVEEKRWIGEARFLHALNYCMLLPGPEAQQLATYIGWLLHRTKGGLVAGLLFILPGFVAMTALSWLYAVYGDVAAVAALFFGLKAAVLAIVVEAVRRIGSRALRTNLMRSIAAVAFASMFFLAIPFPIVIAGAALIGFLARGSAALAGGESGHSPAGAAVVADSETILGEAVPDHARPNLRWSLRISAVFLVLWLAPVGLLLALAGPENVFSQIALFFSKMATVTFGGAYAVLGYVAQEAVDKYRWLTAGEMIDGLGLAETTPGPLIMVTQFVGFLGAFRAATGLPPLLAGLLGGILTTWVTFTPCFLWIFLGAPFIERLRGNRALSSALSAITAAVVGVVLNLAIWFALHTCFGKVRELGSGPLRFDVPVPESVNVAACLLASAAMVAMLRFKLPAWLVLIGCAAAGLVYRLALAAA